MSCFPTSFEIINCACLPHGNVAKIGLYIALRMLSTVVIFFSWNKNKAVYSLQSHTWNHHPSTQSDSQALWDKDTVFTPASLFAQKERTLLPSTPGQALSQYRWVSPGRVQRCGPWLIGTHIASRPFTRMQSWTGNWTVANHISQLQQWHLETTFNELFKSMVICVLKVKWLTCCTHTYWWTRVDIRDTRLVKMKRSFWK